jgi:hypothetical protein
MFSNPSAALRQVLVSHDQQWGTSRLSDESSRRTSHVRAAIGLGAEGQANSDAEGQER